MIKLKLNKYTDKKGQNYKTVYLLLKECRINVESLMASFKLSVNIKSGSNYIQIENTRTYDLKLKDDNNVFNQCMGYAKTLFEEVSVIEDE